MREMKTAILSLLGAVVLCGCGHDFNHGLVANKMPPSPFGVVQRDNGAGRAISEMPVSRPATESLPVKRISIPINCPFTNGYVYLSVSTDLVHWRPLDNNIYDASLPRVPGTYITIPGGLPAWFAMYAQTNWCPE
jgi:hypothetical protein